MAASAAGAVVVQVDVSTGASVNTYTTTSFEPVAVTVDNIGSVFVADKSSSAIRIFDATGTLLSTVVTSLAVRDMALAPSTGLLIAGATGVITKYQTNAFSY